MIEIRPTILEVPKEKIEDTLTQIQPLVKGLHIDVEDGQFVPRVNDFSHYFVSGLKARFDFVYDIHLMVKDPLSMVGDYISSGAEMISFHFEASNHPSEVIKKIKDLGGKACLALKLETDVFLTRPFWE